MISSREVCPAYAAGKKNVAVEQDLRRRLNRNKGSRDNGREQEELETACRTDQSVAVSSIKKSGCTGSVSKKNPLSLKKSGSVMRGMLSL